MIPGGAIHTVSLAEKEAFANHINTVLKADHDIKSMLPLHADTIFDAVTDGIILCKIINAATFSKVPPIAPEAINITPANPYHKVENLNLAIESARSIGCIVINCTPTLIIEKRENIVLGLIWQVIKIHFSNEITLRRHPEIIVLKKEDEAPEVMGRLFFQDILIRWFNWHIKKNNGDRVIHNLGKDLSDGYAYGHVLRNVSSKFNQNAFDNMNAVDKAKHVIQVCKLEGIVTTVTYEDIVCGNVRLNTILAVQIFNERHGLIAEKEVKVVQLAPEKETDETFEMRVFKNWINSQGLDGIFINDLIEDLKTGLVLLKVLDHLRPKSVEWDKRYSDKLHSRIHIVQNCNYVLEICTQNFDIKLVGVGGLNIVDGNITLTLAVVWQLCMIYMNERLGVIKEPALIEWVNSIVPNQVRIKNFKDKSVRNCLALLHVIDSIKPNTVDFAKLKEPETDADYVARINYSISTARKLGCQIITLWEHINIGTTKYIMLFFAELQYIASKKK